MPQYVFVLVKGSQVWGEQSAMSVLRSTFFECLFMTVKKALLKRNQASSTDVMRSISFQDTRAISIRKVCSLKCFRERLTVMTGGRLTADPLWTQGVIAEILVEDSRGVFRGQVGQDDIDEGAHVYGFRVVPGRFHDNLCEIEGI